MEKPRTQSRHLYELFSQKTLKYIYLEILKYHEHNLFFFLEYIEESPRALVKNTDELTPDLSNH